MHSVDVQGVPDHLSKLQLAANVVVFHAYGDHGVLGILAGTVLELVELEHDNEHVE